MKLTLRRKILATNIIVLVITFIVVSLIVIEGLNAANKRMLINNLLHQAEISVISIKQSLLSEASNISPQADFELRSRDYAAKLSRESGIRVLVFSKSKSFLADSENIESGNTHYKELDDVIQGNRAYVIRDYEGSRFLHFSFPVMLSDQPVGSVMFVYPMQEVDDIARNIQILLLISFFVGLLVILLVSILLSYRITQPILCLKQSALEISGGSFKNKITVTTTDEVGELANAFNSMASEIENRIRMINIEKSKLDSVLESMGEGVVAFNHQGEIIAINQRARSIICEQPVLENEIDSLTRKVSTQNSRTVTEINSNTRNLLVCATPLMLDGEGGAVLILNDITELRLLQEKQRLFVTNVSHELKTPLTTIMGYIDLLKTKGTDREVFNTSVHYLEGASERLLRLVDDLIDLSCLSKFEFEIEPRSTDLSGLIKDIVGQMSLKAQKFNIQIHTHIPANMVVLADAARIKQAVVNILDNAIKYSPGGIIHLSLTESGNFVKLEIKDTGCGIPAEMLDKIFEPFYRIDKARARSLGGNGLGLAITKEIIEKHGGKIKLESKEGAGTKVCLQLPK